MNACVVGVGNSFGGDDGAGLAVIRLLRGTVPDGVELVECEGEPISILDALSRCERLVLVDAMRSEAGAGTIRKFVVGDEPLPAELGGPSTHLLGVGEAIELARALGRLPAEVVVYGIEGEQFDAGTELSTPVAAAVPLAAAAVRGEVAR